MQKVEVSIILPCYNEGPTFEGSVNKIIRTLNRLGESWEIIFVEDKSVDKTRETVEKLVKKYKNTRAIYHLTNQGRGRSVSDGIRAARGKICGFLDVDLEVSESYIPLFIEEIKKGSDVIIGKRFYEGGLKSFIRFMASKTYALAVKFLLNMPIEDTEAGYKFFRRSKILPVLKRVHDKHWFWDTEVCVRSYFANLKISQVPVLFVRRQNKKSTVKIIPDTWAYLIKLIKFRSEIKKLKKITNV